MQDIDGHTVRAVHLSTASIVRGGDYGFDCSANRRLTFKTGVPPLEHNISHGHMRRNDGSGACHRSP
jgi:hypothetical protein